ncbi:C1QL [Mytilus edulis]|uniref:C1QL n=1 Tax=Mytilus edulis TaxID=6550 RepID=A0A8S3V4M4_MYTED|nr:C1QL [Mytilus edulis]
MKFGLFGFLISVLAVSVKSETQNIKIHDLMLDEIQNKHYAKILKLETMVMAMNEQLNRQDEKIRSQNERIHEQQRRLNDQDIQIRKHDRQINDVVQHVSELQDSTINDESQNQSMRGSKISPLKQSEPRLNGNIVAFYGYMSHGESQPGKHQILDFDVVKTNVGLAYNKYSGMFTAPVNGVYVFTWTVSTGMHSYVYSQLVINSDPFGAIQTDSDEVSDYHTSTGSVVAELNYGDVVYIRTHPLNS